MELNFDINELYKIDTIELEEELEVTEIDVKFSRTEHRIPPVTTRT
ncbi:hypothetical protein [Streptobacillus ratti]|nr:hypothetical protein [Streptobacillus ratti]